MNRDLVDGSVLDRQLGMEILSLLRVRLPEEVRIRVTSRKVAVDRTTSVVYTRRVTGTGEWRVEDGSSGS